MSLRARDVRVAIVGGGFAGLAAAKKLDRRFAVTLFDPKPCFEFLPNIHELLSGRKRPEELRLDLASRLEARNQRFVRARVVHVDVSAGTLRTAEGALTRFDYLVLSTGLVNNTFGVPGADDWAIPFKSVDDCQRIGSRLRTLMSDKHKPVSVVIVGGGIEGVESLGEILRKYRDEPHLQIHLVESLPRLLTDAPPALDREVRRICRPYSVTFHLRERVARVEPDSVTLDSGVRLGSDLTIWTGGGKPEPLAGESGLAGDSGGFAKVRPTLQSREHPRVFVAGDVAELDQRLGKQAYHAWDMGLCAAENIRRLVAGRALRPFKPSGKPTLVAFGDLDTFLVARNTILAGPVLALAKEAVFQLATAQNTPKTTPRGLKSLGARWLRGLADVALPDLTSAPVLKSLGRVRRVT